MTTIDQSRRFPVELEAYVPSPLTISFTFPVHEFTVRSSGRQGRVDHNTQDLVVSLDKPDGKGRLRVQVPIAPLLHWILENEHLLLEAEGRIEEAKEAVRIVNGGSVDGEQLDRYMETHPVTEQTA